MCKAKANAVFQHLNNVGSTPLRRCLLQNWGHKVRSYFMAAKAIRVNEPFTEDIPAKPHIIFATERKTFGALTSLPMLKTSYIAFFGALTSLHIFSQNVLSFSFSDKLHICKVSIDGNQHGNHFENSSRVAIGWGEYFFLKTIHMQEAVVQKYSDTLPEGAIKCSDDTIAM